LILRSELMSTNRSDTNPGEKRTNAWASSTRGHEPRSEKSADAQLRTAVLLDPDPIWLEAIEQVLRRLDITVVGKAALPKRALALVDERKPDLLIVDIETGDSEIDGIESLRRAREHVPQLTTIALSNDPERVAAAFDAGASAYVCKRTQSDDFVTAIRQLFEKSIFFAGDRPSPVTNHEERRLSRRECEVLRLVAEGRSNTETARTLWVTENTVKFHLANIYRKLGVSNRTEASRWLNARCLVPAENGDEKNKSSPRSAGPGISE